MGRKKKLSKKQLGSIQKATKANQERMKVVAKLKRYTDQCERVDSIINNIVNRTTNYCGHISIGSSNFFRLIQGKLTAERTHQFNQTYAALSIGTNWENFAIKQSQLPLERSTGNLFEVLERHPFSICEECPVLVASCDFIVRYCNNQNFWEEALLEIKSYNREENKVAYEGESMDNQIYQLQVGLQCTRIKKGFLIFVKGSDQNVASCENVAYKVIKVDREDDFIHKQKEKIVAGLAQYYSRCASYPTDPSNELIEHTVQRLISIEEALFPTPKVDDSMAKSYNIERIEPTKVRCKVSSLLRKQLLNQRGIRDRVGRPRLPGNLLKRDRGKTGVNAFKELKFLLA